MAFKVDSYVGVAFGTPVECKEHDDCVVGVMVGDDRKHHLDPVEVHLIQDDEYCSGCGQIGCGW